MNKLVYPIVHDDRTPSFKGGIMTGDVYEGDSDDITVGDIDVDSGDPEDYEGDVVDDTLEGAIRRRRKRIQKRTSVSLKVNTAASAPSVRAAQMVAEKAKDVYMNMPGVTFNATLMPPVLASNAKMVSPGTNQKVQGWLLRHNIERMMSMCTWQTTVVQGVAQNNTGVVTVAWGTPASGTPARVLIPIFFVTVTSSVMQTQVGSRVTLKWTAKDEFGVSLPSDPWVFERVNLNSAMNFSIVPYFRIKDSIKPVLISLFSSTANIVPAGTVDTQSTQPATLSLEVSGLVNSDTVQLVVPGLDSTELRNFCIAWGLKF